MRCRICGRPPSEECNEKTHRAHRRMWEQTAETGRQQDRIQARRILAGLDQVNMEDVNQ